MRSLLFSAAACLGLAAWIAVDSLSKAEDDADVTGDFGDPIPGLDAAQSASFDAGREVFTRRFTRREGLGPHFNATACVSCHEDPVPGGSSRRYRNFFLAGTERADGSTVELYPDCTEKNEATRRTKLCLPSLVMPHYGPKGTIAEPVTADVEHPPIPREATVVAQRNAPPLFGVGLFRLVPDEEILSRADPEDLDGDGISGRVNIIASEEGAIGRFGFKCQTASIEAFNRGALHNQMGITSDSTELIIGAAGRTRGGGLPERLFGSRAAHAQVAEPRDRIVDYDGVRDPEISRSELLALIFFQENLAAPQRGRTSASVRRGEQVFESIGCAACHVPSLPTPRGRIHPYTDLLLHDMGGELADGVTMAGAGGSEFRTQPLWGLCRHAPFLHDGRADTVAEAIELHGGEASRARDGYRSLTEEERALLHRFLASL